MREPAYEHGADSDSDGQHGERQAGERVGEMQDSLGVDENVLREETRDSPKEDFSRDRESEQPLSAKGGPGPLNRCAHAAGGPCGRDLWNGEG